MHFGVSEGKRGAAFKDSQSSEQARADAKVTAIWRYFYSISKREVNFDSFFQAQVYNQAEKVTLDRELLIQMNLINECSEVFLAILHGQQKSILANIR